MSIKIPDPPPSLLDEVTGAPATPATPAPKAAPKAAKADEKTDEKHDHPSVPVVRRAKAARRGADAQAAKPARRTAGSGAVVPSAPRPSQVHLTKEQTAQAKLARQKLDRIAKLDKQVDEEMWEVAEIVGTLLADDHGPSGRQVALALRSDPSTVSSWAKTWRLFGPDSKRLKNSSGAPHSFNDTLERAKLWDEQTGQPKDPDKYRRIQEIAEQEGVSFAVAKRKANNDPSFAKAAPKHTVALAVERSVSLAGSAVSAMGAEPTLNELSELLRSARTWIEAFAHGVDRTKSGAMPKEILDLVETVEGIANQTWGGVAKKL